MVQLIGTLEKLGFLLQEDGTYLSVSASSGNEVLIDFMNHYLHCYESNNLLFSVLFMDFSSETLLILLSDFGIIQKSIKK